MSTGAIFSIAVIAVSLLFLLGNLVTSYRSQGGAIGQLPVMAMPAALPAFASFFLWVINRDMGWPGWPGWIFALVWIPITAIAWWATIYAGNLGTRHAADQDGL